MTKKYKTLILLVCTAAILCMLSSSTFMIIARRGEIDLQKLIRVWLFNIPFIVCFVPVSFYIIRLIHRHIYSWIRFVVDFCTTQAFVTVCMVIYWIGMQMFSLMHPTSFASLLYPSVLWNLIIVMLIELFLYQQELNEREQQMILMEKEKAEYQFRLLKNQLNPHFLFNCLNVAASMAYQDGSKTNRFVKKLSNVYQYLLTTQDSHTVSIKEEMQFVDDYLYLEQIRFEDTLKIDISDYTPYANHAVVPGAIQMLVENAIKHNINTQQMPLMTTIKFSADCIIVSNNLQLRTVTSQALSSTPTKTTVGRGLQNLNQQYILHGKCINVKQTDDTFCVILPYIGLYD